MTVSLTITGPDPQAPAASAASLLRTMTGTEPALQTVPADETGKRDLATGIALASLLVSVPGAVLATLQLKDRLDRRRLKAEVEALKAELAAAKAEGELTIGNRGSIDVARSSTDAVVDENAWVIEGAVAWPEDLIYIDDSTATRSMNRTPGAKNTTSNEDWHTVPTSGSSWGEENTVERYMP